MINKYATYFTTTAGADVTVTTQGGAFLGAICDGSAGGTTLTIVDSGGSIVGKINASSLASVVFSPALPIALTNGLTVTASGTGGYSIYYI
jgi:hypothetical protein